MKSTKVKISKRNTPELKQLIESFSNSVLSLEKSILMLGGKIVRDHDGKVIFNGDIKRRNACKNNKSVIAACDRIYQRIITGGKSHGIKVEEKGNDGKIKEKLRYIIF